MKISDVCQKIELKQMNQVNGDNEIEGVYIGDLLSFVMGNGKEGALWLTVQRHMNVIAVAELNDFAGIIFVEDVEPDADTITQATKLDIPLFVSPLDAYALTKELAQVGL